ncbi:MAG: NAD(P)/FAD-dependent oxidoreductase [Microscillaceae bacterium]|nr:NAD(P)/FAD-dependent oxidoreductase [Microscillaceae bacterium]
MIDPQIYSGLRLGLPDAPWRGKVLIIGAGIAGLSAAQILRKTGIDVQIIEASDRWGGRIWSEKGFYNFAIERGAEEIHGANSVWYQLIQNYGFHCAEYYEERDDYFLIEGLLRSESELEDDQDLQKVFALWDELEGYQANPTQTLADFLLEKSVPPATKYIAEAFLEAEYGASVGKINLQSFLEIHRKWQSGEQNFMLTQASQTEVLEKIFENILPDIQLNQVVREIDYQAEQIIIHCKSGQSYQADKVLLTVPVSILKTDLIRFKPTLPQTKQLAIEHIPMDTGMKIMLKFTQAFWPDDMGSLYGPGLIPEFYTSAKDNTPILTAYIMGDKARQLSEMGQEKIITQALGELGQLFHRGITRQELEDYRIADWGKEPYIQGAYSHPGLNTEYHRKVLATPLDHKLYFAGEATNDQGQAATVQGAIESAYRAVLEILDKVVK